MPSGVILFRGLDGAAATAVLRGLHLPWNEVPAAWGPQGPIPGRAPGGAGRPSGLGQAQTTRITAKERLEFQEFVRSRRSPVWLARVRRPDRGGDQAFLSTKAAVKLGLVDQAAVDRLEAATTPSKLREDAEWLGRQAGLDSARHRGEFVDHLKRWLWTPEAWAILWTTGPVPLVSATILEAWWPGAVAEIAESVVDATRRIACSNPVTGLPAWVFGVCKGTPGWLWPVVVIGSTLALVGGFVVVRKLGR